MAIEVSITGSGVTAVAIPGATYEEYSQSFPSGSGFNLESVSLKLALSAGSPGTVYCDIYAVDGNDLPTGSTLGTASVDSATLNTYPSWSFKVFTFNSVVALTASTQYCFAISVSSGSPSTHYIYIGTNGSDTYANGVMGRYNGSVWSNASNTYPTTIRSSDLPSKATTPAPATTATSISNNLASLTWVDGGGADTFNVYYGTTSGSLSLVSSTQAGASYTVTGTTDGSPYTHLSTRYWRIDSTNTYGTTTGDEWSFTTLQIEPPTETEFYPATGQHYQRLVQADGTYGDSPGEGGVENTDFVYLPATYLPNFLHTSRRLVGIANSKFWFEDI